MSDGIRCMVLRGGSSKGAYFVRNELPDHPTERDDLLRRLIGSPDPRQIDGIGGAHPLTSKVAVIAPSSGPDTDVDYLFLQVGVDDSSITDRQNCGNLLAGVGPFALERGLIHVTDPDAAEFSARIRMLNTDTIAVTRFPVRNGLPVYEGDTAISGVPGTAAAIHLDFADIAGVSAGSLLPTGNSTDKIADTEVTVIDNGMPVVVIAAQDLGITGYETCAELEANSTLRTRLEEIRVEAGRVMNLGDVSTSTIPKLTLVAAPRDGGDLSTRTFIPHRCHDAIGVFGAISVATAALIPGSVANALYVHAKHDYVRLEHPTGFFDAIVVVRTDPSGLSAERAGIVRTARKLMDGVVFPHSY